MLSQRRPLKRASFFQPAVAQANTGLSEAVGRFVANATLLVSMPNGCNQWRSSIFAVRPVTSDPKAKFMVTMSGRFAYPTPLG